MSDTTIRLPADMAERVDAVAEQELRSRNNAALVLLHEALSARRGASTEPNREASS